MICPFRIDVVFDYETKARKYTTEKTKYVVKAQREVFPPCMREECPFYDPDYSGSTDGTCKRINIED